MTDLDPLDPETAVEMYLTERRTDLSKGTLTNHENYLDRFKEWCTEEEIENLNGLSGRDLHQFRQWRADDGLTQDSLQTQLNTVRQFIWFCESIDATEQGLGEKMLIPSRTGESRDEKLESEEAEAILDYLEQFEYGTCDHAIFLTMWHTGARMGAVQSLDVSDFDEDGPLLLFEHRPEEGTSLKNGRKESATSY